VLLHEGCLCTSSWRHGRPAPGPRLGTASYKCGHGPAGPMRSPARGSGRISRGPSTKSIDREEKMPLDTRLGVQYAWPFDPEARTLEVYRR
jgi:hypothetical protein